MEDASFNFYNNKWVLRSSLCMTEEIWMSHFFWHQDIRVIQCQPGAMNFVFTQYSFNNSFTHILLATKLLLFQQFVWSCSLKLTICSSPCNHRTGHKNSNVWSSAWVRKYTVSDKFVFFSEYVSFVLCCDYTDDRICF